jgi:CheY-like chemotaxis protein
VAVKILLADDSAPAKSQGKKILEDAGYEVVACSNGLEAQRKIAESRPDLAILDIFMPGYSGLELCDRLRADPATASLPVILTVGQMEPYRREEGDQVRASAVVIKPFGDEELISAVRNLIGAPGASVARKAFGAAAARGGKPLLEWWDPAAEAIERSIAAAQLRRGTPGS